MIALTKLDGATVYVNPDLMQYIEAHPDTRITLITGTRLIVREDPPTIVERLIKYRRAVAVEGNAARAMLGRVAAVGKP